MFVILGLTLAGSGWFVLAGGRRRDAHNTSSDDDGPVELLPDHAWTELVTARIPGRAAAPVAVVDPTNADAPSDDDAPTDTAADNDPDGSAFVDAVAPQDSEDDAESPEAIADEVTEPAAKPEITGGNGIVEDLLQLMDDLAED